MNVNKKLVTLILCGIFTVNAYSLYNLYNDKQYHRMELTDNWKKVAAFVESSRDESAVISSSNLAFKYYYEAKDKKNEGTLIDYKEPNGLSKLRQDLNRSELKEIWLIDTPLSTDQPYINLWEVMLAKKGYELKASAHFSPDSTAELKRKYIKRPFSQYRISVYHFVKG